MVKTKKSLTGADFLEWKDMESAPGCKPGACRYICCANSICGCAYIEDPARNSYRVHLLSSASLMAARVMPMVMKKAKRIRG